jgi:outer membrane lipoprotein SlyB
MKTVIIILAALALNVKGCGQTNSNNILTSNQN